MITQHLQHTHWYLRLHTFQNMQTQANRLCFILVSYIISDLGCFEDDPKDKFSAPSTFPTLSRHASDRSFPGSAYSRVHISGI